jgi:hypothetical protein
MVLAALRLKSGRIILACDEAGVSRQTHYNWYRTDPDYRERFDNTIAEMRDALNKLLSERIRKAIEEGDKKAVDEFRFIMGQPALDLVKRGKIYPFNYI